MASESRDETDRLKAIVDIIKAQGDGDFRAIVIFLERALMTAAKVGHDGPVSQEIIRFRNDPSLAFPTSDVSSVELIQPEAPLGMPKPERIIEIITTFLGLTGSVSPLPTYLTEEVAQESPIEPVLRDFYDIFHHRIVALLFRSIIRYCYPITFKQNCNDAWSKRILSLCGVDTYDHEYPSSLPVWQILRLAPLLHLRRPTCWVIQTALRDVLQIDLEGSALTIQQFIGSWIPFDKSEQTTVGVANSHLDVDFVLGSCAFDRAGKFRVQIGPCSREVYYRFRQNVVLRRKLLDTIKLFCRDPLEVDLGIILAHKQISGLRLSTTAPERLGVDTFLAAQHQHQIVLPLQTVTASYVT
ncbi:MAG: type VI secretion system baseplate subunit TssG [Deltaproteobacteria bacterium]|nr:type VI secretion system baseplate subunit TssG [Deltaproteobacteria bacterium]